MVSVFQLHLLLIEFGTLHSYFGSATLVDVVNGNYRGVAFYISAKRDAIQNKLEAYYRSASHKSDGGQRLFLPDASVLPELHNVDRHPVFISFGHVESYDFDDYLKNNLNPCVSVSGLEVAVTIPFLARNSTGPPQYALAVEKFYERWRGDIPKINVLYPYIAVDGIILTDHRAVVRNAGEEMRISFDRIKRFNCKTANFIVKAEFEKFLHSEYQFGLSSPDYSFCDRHRFGSKFCENAKRVKCGVNRYAPNVCQKWSANDKEHCATTVVIDHITSKFRDSILVGDDPINILASESLYNNFTLALKYPCED